MGSAFISPDDPIPERSNFEGAFISPDDPIPDRRATEEDPEERWARAAGVSALDVNPDDVVVTGIGDDAHLDPREMAYTGDPHVREVVEAVKKLAAALERKGEVALRHSSDMSRLETQLRAYCVGFLAGRRAEDGEV